MEVPAIKVRQAGKVLYLGSMTAQQLLDSCVTTEWDPNIGWDLTRQGYQREPNEKHYKGIARYLATYDNPFMPNGALLSSRDQEYGALKFRNIGDGATEFGYLVVPNTGQLFIVDYQHRWRAFRQVIEKEGGERLRDYVIPVTIMPDAERFEEIEQFYVINSKQRRIDTDLALALLQTMAGTATEDELISLVGRGKRYRIRATRLTFKIAGSTSGPWAGRIKQPHDVLEPGAVLSVKSFTDSLRPIISSRSPVAQMKDPELVRTIRNYWNVLSSLMPEAFKSPRGYSVQKTPGVFSLHIVAAKTVFRLCQKQSDYSSMRMEKYLSVANKVVAGDDEKYMESAFWITGGPVKQYASSGGQRALATLIRNKIEAKHPVA